jgi:NDP-sugar pyrophosphorylase family protein
MMNNVLSYQVAILAGGLGTRLKGVGGGLPKPMVNIAGKPMLEHLLNMCLILN